jgi:hypothetical protein
MRSLSCTLLVNAEVIRVKSEFRNTLAALEQTKIENLKLGYVFYQYLSLEHFS